MSPSFEEKSTWVQLVAMVLGLGAYFAISGSLLARGVLDIRAYAANLLLLSLALSETLGFVLRLVAYRRGI